MAKLVKKTILRRQPQLWGVFVGKNQRSLGFSETFRSREAAERAIASFSRYLGIQLPHEARRLQRNKK